MEEKDKDKEKGDALLEEPEMSDAEIMKARLKFFLLLVGVLLILVIISVILLIALDKDLPPQKMENLNNWDDSYTKAKEFVSKLSRHEKVGLLYGTENMRFLNLKDEKELDALCVGQLIQLKKTIKQFLKGK